MNFRPYIPNTITTQLFIQNEEINTHYTIMNFSSFLSPKTAYRVKYVIKIFAGKQKEFLKRTYILEPFQSKNISFENEKNLPREGIVTIEMEPVSILSPSDYHLKRLIPHFYTKFISKDNKSIGLVHTQTRFNVRSHSHNWKSSLAIDSTMVKKVIAYQINPKYDDFKNNLTLYTSENIIVESKQFLFKQLSASKQEFILDSNKLLHFRIDKTSTPNAKPLLFLYFQDNTFSVVHS